MPGPILSTRAILFLALLLPVCTLGAIRGLRMTGSIAALAPFFAEELARFNAVRPHLAHADAAVLLLDPSARRSYGERFFAAQYSLAPTVLSLTFRVDDIAPSGVLGEARLILCAADDPRRKAAMLSALESAARQRGWTFVLEPIDDRLTLVRLGGS